nr:hypothetical protein [Streptomyces sp. TLI_235]
MRPGQGRHAALGRRQQEDCYPVYWTPPGGTAPVLDWFNKTAVSQVAVSDTTKADSPARITNYAYGDAAWHRDDSELTDDQYRTWNDFRGFATVTTTSGDATTDPVGKTVVSYHQGMDGDFLSHGTRPVTGDSPWLAGSSIERDTYSQDGGQGTVLSKQLTDVLVGEPVLSRARTAWSSKQGATLSTLPPLEVRRVQSVTSTSSAALSAPGTWRTGRTTSYLDEYGRTVRTEAQPDVTSLLGQTCSKTGYAAAPSGNPMMLTYTSTILTVSGTCDTTPSATTTISDRRTVYDGSSDPATRAGWAPSPERQLARLRDGDPVVQVLRRPGQRELRDAQRPGLRRLRPRRAQRERRRGG